MGDACEKVVPNPGASVQSRRLDDVRNRHSTPIGPETCRAAPELAGERRTSAARPKCVHNTIAMAITDLRNRKPNTNDRAFTKSGAGIAVIVNRSMT